MKSERNYRLLVDNATEAIFVMQDEVIRFANPMAEVLTGYSTEELARVPFIDIVHPEDGKMVAEIYERQLRGDDPSTIISSRIRDKAGEERWVRFNATRVTWEERPAMLVFGTDITQQVKIESQLVRSQKMETVGRLAGGIAHDFNNFLTVIIGYCDVVLGQINEQDPIRGDMEEIRRAGERCSMLTRKLLAFSRRQVLSPTVFNLNGVVIEMNKMLSRLIGEDIDLVILLEKDLWNVKADIGQVEQVIMNLVVNSRDAMPRGGRLAIETANVELDEICVREKDYISAGSYVMLSVSDTGGGMDEYIRSHVFEPFFTTKEGGSGLGLATVYGIVKQSMGSIHAYSEPGIGTVMKIFLPREKAEAEEIKPVEPPLRELRGSETILLVEDEEMVRQLTREILKQNGHNVFEARNGDEALRISEQYGDEIHLMLTDVVMPGMSGVELSKRIAIKQPEMKVLYMSGYTEEMMVQKGIQESRVHFIEKPFTINLLVSKVRQVLDAVKDKAI